MSVPRVSSPVTQLAYQSFFFCVDDPVPAAPGPCAPKPMLKGTRSESAVAAVSPSLAAVVTFPTRRVRSSKSSLRKRSNAGPARRSALKGGSTNSPCNARRTRSNSAAIFIRLSRAAVSASLGAERSRRAAGWGFVPHHARHRGDEGRRS